MAIFTSTANYLKCRNYFEHVLGFETVDPTDPNYGSYGFLCSDKNLRVAQNTWFLYGGSLPWDTYSTDDPVVVYGEDNPPKETEDGFVLKTDNFKTTDVVGFILDPENDTSQNKYFIGMKRLVPLEDSTYTEGMSLSDIKSKYRDVLQFVKNGLPVAPTNTALNASMPNELKITTSYDYGDFGYKEDGSEYDVRQIGMLNHLCCKSSTIDNLLNSSIVSNHMSNNMTISSIFNISQASIILPSTLDVDSFPTEYGPKDQTTVSESGFFGVLHFYLNSRANNRITYQTDYYSFVLRFENKLKCECTCSQCNC